MARVRAKAQERIYSEAAARLLGKTWHIGPDQENPDFIVTESGNSFGLEVTSIFTGPQGRDGSAMKAVESTTDVAIQSARRQYEETYQTTLSVHLVGDLSDLDVLVPRLAEADFASRPISERCWVEVSERLRAWTRRSTRPDWRYIGHEVGWVDRNPVRQIEAAISAKAGSLQRYTVNAGADVRLLIVADRYFNSGKMMLEGRVAVDPLGFSAVYFVSYPESVTELSRCP